MRREAKARRRKQSSWKTLPPSLAEKGDQITKSKEVFIVISRFLSIEETKPCF